jgi:proteasome-associated ATPase
LVKHLTPDIPIHSDELAAHRGNTQAAVAEMTRRTVEFIYAENAANALFEVNYANGDKTIVYLRHFSSGVVIRDIVDRAKSLSVVRFLESRNLGLRTEDLLRAAAEEIGMIEDFARIENPDDWARISGQKGERIFYIRKLSHDEAKFAGLSIKAATDKYL